MLDWILKVDICHGIRQMLPIESKLILKNLKNSLIRSACALSKGKGFIGCMSSPIFNRFEGGRPIEEE